MVVGLSAGAQSRPPLLLPLLLLLLVLAHGSAGQCPPTSPANYYENIDNAGACQGAADVPGSDSLLPWGWRNTDVNPGPTPGWATVDDNATPRRVHLVAGGVDIWNADDGMHFMYRSANDTTFRAVCTLLSEVRVNRYEWSKSALMLRRTLGSNSAHYSTIRGTGTTRGFVTVHERTFPSDNTQPVRNYPANARANTDAPHQMRVTRDGDRFTSEWRTDDQAPWELFYDVNLPGLLGDQFLWGIGLTGHDGAGDRAAYHQYDLDSIAVEPFCGFAGCPANAQCLRTPDVWPDSPGHNRCVCNPGWTGTNCDQVVPTTGTTGVVVTTGSSTTGVATSGTTGCSPLTQCPSPAGSRCGMVASGCTGFPAVDCGTCANASFVCLSTFCYPPGTTGTTGTTGSSSTTAATEEEEENEPAVGEPDAAESLPFPFPWWVLAAAGAGLCCCCCVVLALFLLVRRRRRRDDNDSSSSTADGYGIPLGMMGGGDEDEDVLIYDRILMPGGSAGGDADGDDGGQYAGLPTDADGLCAATAYAAAAEYAGLPGIETVVGGAYQKVPLGARGRQDSAHGSSSFFDESPSALLSADDVMIDPTSKVGRGEFGDVFRGQVGAQQVAVKTVRQDAMSEAQLQAFFEEATLLARLPRHENLIGFVGVIPEPLLLVMDLAEKGSLLRYLRQGADRVSESMSVKIMRDIAAGMSHLAAHGVVHRDLAARNVLLSSSLTCMVSDFGMSSELEAGQDAHKSKTSMGPFRWMAPESVRKGIYSEKSDVWAYGVTCFEVWSAGDVPYLSMMGKKAKAMDILRRVLDGERLTFPARVPADILSLLEGCFLDDRDQRPDFVDIVQRIDDIVDGTDVTYASLAQFSEVGDFSQFREEK